MNAMNAMNALARQFLALVFLATFHLHCHGEVHCVDDRLQIAEFAASPNIVQPVSACIDARGRLLVIENHTHFRPDDYVGPEFDRIRVIEDRDGDGVADSFETFFESEKDSMDLACHPDGSIYLATRRKILRLRDDDGDGRAEKLDLIVRLETDGNYPHNGLSGLTFDFDGNLQFGFGENLGADYKLIGSDGTQLIGGAEGGSTYRCTADGRELTRVATGFWNPFGQCTDSFGNVFAVDNDPDASPPCRLLHVVEGGNYGYQFRYGRPGKHPLQTWTGSLPGTLPMIAGTGEAPCEVVCYEHNGLPADYIGDLLVASWGDHRIERFRLKRNGASFEAERSIIVQGNADFWPVGIAVANDGSLFITDWASRSYPLHGQGRVWKLSAKEKVSGDPLLNRETREASVREIIRSRDTGAALQRMVDHESINVRASAIHALAVLDPKKLDEHLYGAPDALRALAVRLSSTSSITSLPLLHFGDGKQNDRLLLVELLRRLKSCDSVLIATGLIDDDPFVRNAAVEALVRCECKFANNETIDIEKFKQRVGIDSSRIDLGLALAYERLNQDSADRLPKLLAAANENVRFVAARWAADQGLEKHKDAIQRAVSLPTSDFRATLGLLSAIRHLEGKKFNDDVANKTLDEVLLDDRHTAATKVLALKAARSGALPMTTLTRFAWQGNTQLWREAIYLLAGDDRPEEVLPLLTKTLEDDATDSQLRADALVAIDSLQRDVERLLQIASAEYPNEVRATALRLIHGAELNAEQRAMLSETEFDDRNAQLRQRLLQPISKPAESLNRERQLDELLIRISKNGDALNGRRLFANQRLLQCSKCHAVENRGADIGPDLTGIASVQGTKELLQSVLDPSQRIAPQYQPWVIVSNDGLANTGYHLATNSLVDTYVDANGKRFEIAHENIAERHETEKSIMPDGLIDHLTDEELSDLFAYLGSGE